jgi:hypothetical protein
MRSILDWSFEVSGVFMDITLVEDTGTMCTECLSHLLRLLLPEPSEPLSFYQCQHSMGALLWFEDLGPTLTECLSYWLRPILPELPESSPPDRLGAFQCLTAAIISAGPGLAGTRRGLMMVIWATLLRILFLLPRRGPPERLASR